MPIDPLTEKLLPLKTAANYFPARRRGSKVAISTIWRWIHSGTRAGVRLGAIRIGNQTYTSEHAIGEFIAAQNEPRDATSPSTGNAIKRLARLGL